MRKFSVIVYFEAEDQEVAELAITETIKALTNATFTDLDDEGAVGEDEDEEVAE